jgi:MEMO1 family protein
MDMSTISDLRPPALAGKWYPAQPELLAEKVDQYMYEASLPQPDGEVIAVIAPHAGHKYSGPVAGYAFAALRGLKLELVAVVAPMHHPYPQRLITSAHQAYATPLGVVEIDQQALAELDDDLAASLGSGLSRVREDPEHSLEIELPFLQRVLPAGFRLLPVMMRDQSLNTASQLGRSLARVLRGRRALLVASTDLSHFYPQETAAVLDGEVLRCLSTFNPIGLYEAEDKNTGYACGKGALAAVLWAAHDLGARRVEVLRYATSGDITGMYDQVVGYAAAVCLR